MTPALSPSRASDFMQCPLLYRFRVIDRLPEPPSAAAARGTLVHAALERVFDLPAAERTPEAAVALLPTEWARLVELEPELAGLVGASEDLPGPTNGTVTALTATPGQPGELDAAAGDGPTDREQAWFDAAAGFVRTWFTLEDPTRLEPAERELYVEAEVDGLVLRGYVDRLDIAPDGRLRVVDYKTGRSPSELWEGKALFQMKFYALVLWRTRGVLPTLLQLVYLRDGQILRYAPDEQDLLATERKVRALWEAIERAAETGDWRASRSRLCDWCHHKPICPAWGGTPPPLPEDAAVRALDPRATGQTDPAADAAD
ncbi:RecB family exonuclease [Ornithinimicrobium cavernae]|uniref:RecB family exonuclease n=1 Tax=Ornithinimicrobium cavernae TaxID=2666047 RepID=UPI000D69B033|nr:PD-(D/E)XK nuclease family protein [Ornithinimicrobium cavernae]